jgi:hypothetical protein
MIKLTKKEIEGLQVVGPRVLIKPNRKIDEIYINNGDKLYFDPTFNPEQHAPVTGEVIKVCTHARAQEILGFTPTIEAKIGDNAIFGYIAASMSLDPRVERNIIDENGQIYFWINYHDLIAIIRGEERFPVNHWHIVEPVQINHNTIIELPDHLKRKESLKLAKVLMAPKYRVEYATDRISHGEIANPGTYILVDKHGIQNFEHEIHRSFMGRSKPLSIVAQRDIMAIIPETLINKINE